MLEDYLQGFAEIKQFQINSPSKINSQKDELLLSNERASFTNLSQNEESILNLLIAPFKQTKFTKNQTNISEDKTILNGSSTLKISAKDDDIIRLKQIIDNKNHIIGQLTEEMRQMSDKIVILCKHGTNKFQQLKQNKQYHCTSHRKKQCFKPESRINYQKNLQFLQNNNNQLYKELRQCQKQRQFLKVQLKQKQLKTNELEKQLRKLNSENQQLKKINFHLTRQTKRFLNDSQKEIHIVSKMRQIIAQKLCQKDINQERKGSKNNGRRNLLDDKSKSVSKRHRQRQIETTLTKKISLINQNTSFMSNTSQRKNNKEKFYRRDECSSFSKSMSRLGK